MSVAEYSHGTDYNLKFKASRCENCVKLFLLPEQ